MQTLRIFGHPLHPAVVHFPIAAWTTTLFSDLAYVLNGDAVWWTIAYWSMLVGIVTGVLAMGAGFIELVAIAADHPAWPAINQHMAFMGGSWLVFVVDLILREVEAAPSALLAWPLAALSGLGYMLLLVGGHKGASLVYAHGLGRARGSEAHTRGR